MAKRTVEFTVGGEQSVSPAIPLYGGVKGEHNATCLRVYLQGEAYTAGDELRLSFTTGDGTILSSDLFTAEEILTDEKGTYIEYALPQLLTVAAGQLCVRVVTSGMSESDEEEQTERSPEMVLYFDEAEVENGTPFWTGVSEMLRRTVTASGAAVNAQEATASAQDKAQQYALSARENAKAAGSAFELADEAAQNAVAAKTAAETAAASAWEAVETPGRKGEDGKSAYQQAQEGGYTGTEDEFAQALAMCDGLVQMRTDIDANTGAHVAAVAAYKELEERVEDNTSRIAADESNVAALQAGQQTHRECLLDLNERLSTVEDDSKEREERLSVLESADTLRYKGTSPASNMSNITNKDVGDVYFVTSGIDAFYMWDGTDWTPLCKLPSTEVAQGDASPVTGGAVYDYVAEKVASVYRYRGSVDTYEDLAAITEQEVGDVWNVIWEDATDDDGVAMLTLSGQNYAWTGTRWDALGSTFKLVSAVSDGVQYPPTSSAVYDFVMSAIADYDTDVMTVLGVDEE